VTREKIVSVLGEKMEWGAAVERGRKMVKWRGGKVEDDAAVAVSRGGSNRKLKRGGAAVRRRRLSFFRVRFFSFFLVVKIAPPLS
jgi:hypothetical protein